MILRRTLFCLFREKILVEVSNRARQTFPRLYCDFPGGIFGCKTVFDRDAPFKSMFGAPRIHFIQGYASCARVPSGGVQIIEL